LPGSKLCVFAEDGCSNRLLHKALICTTSPRITKGSNVFGYTSEARNIMDREYKKYNYDKLLSNLAELVLGETKVSRLKQQSMTISPERNG